MKREPLTYFSTFRIMVGGFYMEITELSSFFIRRRFSLYQDKRLVKITYPPMSSNSKYLWPRIIERNNPSKRSLFNV